MRGFIWISPLFAAGIYVLIFGFVPRLILFPFALTPAILWLPEIVAGLIVLQVLFIWLRVRIWVSGFVLGVRYWWSAIILEVTAIALISTMVPAFLDFTSRDLHRLKEVGGYFFGADLERWRAEPQDFQAEYRLNHILYNINHGDLERAQKSLDTHLAANPPEEVTWYGDRTALHYTHRLKAAALSNGIKARQQMSEYLRNQAELAGWGQPLREPRLVRISYFLEIIEVGNEISQGTLDYYYNIQTQINQAFQQCRSASLDALINQLNEELFQDVFGAPITWSRWDTCADVRQRALWQWANRNNLKLIQALEDLIDQNQSPFVQRRWTVQDHPDYPYRSIGAGALRELWIEWTSDRNITRRHCPQHLRKRWGYSADLSISYWQCRNYWNALL